MNPLILLAAVGAGLYFFWPRGQRPLTEAECKEAGWLWMPAIQGRPGKCAVGTRSREGLEATKQATAERLTDTATKAARVTDGFDLMSRLSPEAQAKLKARLDQAAATPEQGSSSPSPLGQVLAPQLAPMGQEVIDERTFLV